MEEECQMYFLRDCRTYTVQSYYYVLSIYISIPKTILLHVLVTKVTTVPPLHILT